MKILVFSDSHHNISHIRSVVEACKQDTSLIVHLGDMCSDCRKITELFPDIPSVCVKGNNDFFEVGIENEYIAEFEGIRCFFTHGHQYGVKGGIGGISVRARALKSDLVLFGHTHTPYKELRGKTLFFNPGSAGDVREATFGIIQLSNSAILSADILTHNSQTNKIEFLRLFR